MRDPYRRGKSAGERAWEELRREPPPTTDFPIQDDDPDEVGFGCAGLVLAIACGLLFWFIVAEALFGWPF